MRMLLDMYSGRIGWGKAFLARGWKVTAVDLVKPASIPAGVEFLQCDARDITADFMRQFDFGCASSPCENFSVFGMKHFFPDPPYPTLGIELFNDTREKFEESSIPFVMENVRSAQQFLGKSFHHCGPFHLWGNAVPPLMPQGIVKTKRRIQLCRCLPDNQYRSLLKEGKTRAEISVIRNAYLNAERRPGDRSQKLKETAEIPPELANCVADYAERLLEQRRCA